MDNTREAVTVVIAGLVVIAVLGGIAMFQTDDNDMAPLATAAFGVIGSVVGAFFGVHAGAGMARRETEKTHELMVMMMSDDEEKKKEIRAALGLPARESERK